MDFRQFIKDNICITDGAMGTYYSNISCQSNTIAELANISNPDLIRSIHQEYVQAGARLIRTNTFSANTPTLRKPLAEVLTIIKQAWVIANEAIKGSNAFVAANIGPIPEQNVLISDYQAIQDELVAIVDTFLQLGAQIFVFETQSDLEQVRSIVKYIKQQSHNSFILTQFALTPAGSTRKGLSIQSLLKEIKDVPEIDAFGFNCGVGPTHLFNLLKGIDWQGSIVSALPNSGYPEIINERTVYNHNPEYFAQVMVDFKDSNFKILGGCCGTTPEHIKLLANKVLDHPSPSGNYSSVTVNESRKAPVENSFYEYLINDRFPIAVELSPPTHSDVSGLIQAAQILKNAGAKIITISDSPLARTRVDSIVLAAKIRREIGIQTLPHLCCRDRNIIGLKAGILAAHMEGIRNILIVTGDPIPSSDRSEIKSVFNLNSIQLMKLVQTMNSEVFLDDPIRIGGALNLSSNSKDLKGGRLVQKIAAGASFFLTQPVYSLETLENIQMIKNSTQAKVLLGIMPIVSYRNAMFLHNEVPGISIPSEVIKRFENVTDKESAKKIGVELALELADQLKGCVDGFYFITPLNQVGMIENILRQLKKD
ncbi:MAG: bifunctional homocysteine S-methyltransferase/methylenetetrahydrofolate reductase [Firmicutes bacterium]|nr:bifunctional homocysteine S-methyltransferase/methylenetetrahydrofolate reductase [Bacillota bacterium]